jgi:hypothetical protein
VRIEFRIGIHVGDIIIDDNDNFGDGVNIAARLEGIAEPGGVCISDDAQRQVRGKVDIVFDDMGPQSLKNIAELMRAWRMPPLKGYRGVMERRFISRVNRVIKGWGKTGVGAWPGRRAQFNEPARFSWRVPHRSIS